MTFVEKCIGDLLDARRILKIFNEIRALSTAD